MRTDILRKYKFSLLPLAFFISSLSFLLSGCGGGSASAGGNGGGGGGGNGGGGGGSQPPTIVSFAVSPSTVARGKNTSVTFSWQTSGATSVSIDHGVGSGAASGSISVAPPTATTTYTLTATGSGGTATAQATVTVGTGDITSVNHIIFMLQENRSFDHYFGNMNHYRTARFPGTTMTDVDTIDNSGLSLRSNPADGAAALTWSTSGATPGSVTVTGVASPPPSGTTSVTPSTATLYTVTATNLSGSASASIVVGVTPDANASSPAVLAGVSPTSIAPPDSSGVPGTAMLSWAATGGSSVTISPSPDPQNATYAPHARIQVHPSTTTTYTITSNTASTTVTVTVAAPVAGAPSASITDNTQGHVSVSPKQSVASFLLHDQCVEDFSPDWLESHGAFNRDDPGSSSFLGNGFVHIAGGFAQYANSQNDPFHYFDVRGARAMGYFDDTTLPYYYFMAGQFATSDNWFSPVSTNSPSNRLFALAATSKGNVHAKGVSLGATPAIFDRLEDAHISWKVYYSDRSAISKQPNTTVTAFNIGVNHPNNIAPVDCSYAGNPPTILATPCGPGQTDYFTDLRNGTLPQVVLIEPGFDSGRDEHPGNDVQSGALYVSKIINALMTSPAWGDSVFILSYDEAGGLYDHVKPAPATPPDAILPAPLSAGGDLITSFDTTQGRWIDKDAFTMCTATDPASKACLGFERTGFRVPMFLVSPFAKPHFVWHKAADNTAILTFIEKRFNLPALNARDAAQPDITDFFDFLTVPWSTPPTPPVQPTNAPCYSPASRQP